MTNQLKINSPRLKRYRSEHGLSQAELSERLNIHQTTYSKFENGKTGIKLDSLLNLANTLNIPAGELIIREDRLPAAELANPFHAEIRELIGKLNHLLDLSIAREQAGVPSGSPYRP